jgi:predicted dehydrogenase
MTTMSTILSPILSSPQDFLRGAIAMQTHPRSTVAIPAAMQRRSFLRGIGTAAGAAAMAGLTDIGRAEDPNRKLRVAVAGLGRGMGHVQAILKVADAEIAYLAEVDPQRLALGMKSVEGKQDAECKAVKDFRSALDDTSLDAVFIALPNFWHTPAALLAMQAGKHVYVEKPASQNPREAEMIVAATRKYARVVQMGNQRRTWMKDAITALHSGAIGTVRFGRGFYYNTRGSVPAKNRVPPADLDLNLWQGPVPDDPKHSPADLAHYDWHWFWHWGNGELGNNGVHHLDVLRWGLRVDHPLHTSYTGGRYWFNDQQETPDTATAAYDFGHVGCEWVQSSCMPRAAEKPAAEVVFYGDDGTMAISRDSWKVFDPKGVEKSDGKSSVEGSDLPHVANFLEAVRGRAALNSPITEGQKSTMLCHLGNIAYRTNTVVRCDPKSGAVIDNPQAMALWGRESYRPGWDVRV